MERFSRTELLLGKEKLKKLQKSSVTIVGLGAVGSYAVEAMGRSGVGNFRLVDFDIIRPSNINRHIWALESTLGKPKVLAGRERLLDINPSVKVESFETFAAEETMDQIFTNKPDVVIDAIDSFNPKIQLLEACYKRNLPIISSMGAATRTDPFKIKTGDIFDTKVCPLASRIRQGLKEKGVGRGILCVYSEQHPCGHPLSANELREKDDYKRGRVRQKLGSLSTITGIFGLILANLAIEAICNRSN